MGITLADIDRVYQGLQHLSLQPTKNNTAILLDAMTVLEGVAAMMDTSGQPGPAPDGAEAEGEETDGREVDAE